MIGKIVKKGSLVVMIKLIGYLLTFIGFAFAARKLTVNEFSSFNLFITIAAVSSILTRLGLENFILKSSSIYSKKRRDRHLSYSLYLALIFGLFFALTLLFSYESLNSIFGQKLNVDHILLSFLIIPLSLNLIIAEYLKGIGELAKASIFQQILPPIFFLIFIIFSLGNLLDVTLSRSIAVFWLLGYLITIIIQVSYVRPPSVKLLKIRKILPGMLSKSLPMIVISSGALIMNWSDIFILGFLGLDTDIAKYSVSSKVALSGSIILMGINAVVGPIYAKKFYENKKKQIESLSKNLSLVFTIAALLFLSIIFLYENILIDIFGEKYDNSRAILITLSIGQFFNISLGSLALILRMSNNEFLLSKIIMISACINIVLSFSLFQIFGALGISISTSLSMIIWNFSCLYMIRKKLMINTVWFLKDLRN